MGVSVQVTGDVRELVRMAQKFDKISQEATKVIAQQIGEEARDLVLECFSSGRSPDGAAWAPLKVRSGMPLRDDGALASSVTYEVSGLEILVGTNVWYGAVHQKGMVIKPKKKKALYSAELNIMFGKKVTIPARPFLPTGDLPASWSSAFSETARDTLEALLT